MEERNWKSLFEGEVERIAEPYKWDFTLDNNLQKFQGSSPGWLEYKVYTVGRFCCSLCTRYWDSAHVHLLFLMKIARASRCGTVKMRIFKQKCRSCTRAVMEKPDISQENITIVIGNLVNRIESKIYLRNNYNKDRKPVVYDNYTEGPHDKEHCEACQAIVCHTSMAVPGNLRTIGRNICLVFTLAVIIFPIIFWLDVKY
ncbi:hypothetical protein XENTR_v10014406 [Xenopus tropicalis]|uniref:LOC100127813 protein n=1 Tax=Xenopus tropicalis TaxID=8364 RepID=A9JTP5_XENTR|nr:receptor transporter protein 3 [Xenopus tropicalis]AAI55426.1 LOC100127813 protein [Xenopus tropicalis]KAE8603654.1 hypothetical protein XENTR_v10014406 [Xenopus tropicalis]|eukprot:NP_001106595.1 receptor (chemosensory) transporter protein 3 [Xenopus tropicalis]